MAFVIIVHLDPHHESQMAELLQASTAMPVRQIAGALTAEPPRDGTARNGTRSG